MRNVTQAYIQSKRYRFVDFTLQVLMLKRKNMAEVLIVIFRNFPKHLQIPPYLKLQRIRLAGICA
jgi:hypothetical protein